MNSVFSAFKSSKSDGSIQSNKGKKPGPANSSSYANLRHIREIGSSAKMSSFVGNNDDDDIAPNLRLNKCSTLHSTGITATTSTSPPPPSSPSMEQIIPDTIKINTQQNECDNNMNKNTTRNIYSDDSHVSSINDIKSVPVTTDQHTLSAITKNSQSSNLSNNYTYIPCTNGAKITTDGVTDHSSRNSENKENTDTTNPSSTNTSDSLCPSDSSIESNNTDNSDKHQTHDSIHTNAGNEKHTPILSAASNKKLNRQSETNTSATSNKSTSNRLYKRLSLTGLGSNPLPSVHGRSTTNSQNGNNNNCGTGETKRTRISTHQRNLSLDFR